MKFARPIIIISLIGILSPLVFADIIRVPSDYPTIGQGIAAALDGDTVLVAAGTYAEHLDFSGKDILVTSEQGAESTFIERQTQGFPLVKFESGESSEAILDGFTIRLADNVAAIDIDDASPIVKNNIFLANNRGGIKAENGSFPEILDNVFVNNSAPGGGAIYCSQSVVILSGNKFIANSTSNHGGAVYLWQSDGSVIDHNLFYQNQSHSLGGAICLSECQNIEFYNNTVAFNGTDQQYHGGGIAIWDSHDCQIYNNIIANNSGEGIFQGMIFSSTATYNDVWGNDDDYYDIDPGVGSISANPLFVGGVPFSFELTADSPCIDAGDPNSPPDPDGTAADMGGYSYIQGPGASFDIGEEPVDPDMTVSLPIYAFRLNNMEIAGLEFHIEYDNEHLVFNGFSSGYLDNALVNDQDGFIHIIWEDFENPVIFADSSICLELQFEANGEYGDTCLVVWSGESEIVDSNGAPIIIPGLHDGFVYIDCTLGLDNESVINPNDAFLCGNYPNPFNGNTTIEFGLSHDSRVTLDVYDILGSKIETAVDDYYPAGNHSVTWSSANKPSGIYFYKIMIDDYYEIRKMSLIK